MAKVKHINTGECPKCTEFLANAHKDLVEWFMAEQAFYPDLHVSCSIRNEADQAAAKEGGASKASYGQSPHNYSPAWAIDLFVLKDNKATWPMERFKLHADRKPKGILWGSDWNDNGETKDERFKDGPHFEIAGWKKLESRYPEGSV